MMWFGGRTGPITQNSNNRLGSYNYSQDSQKLAASPPFLLAQINYNKFKVQRSEDTAG